MRTFLRFPRGRSVALALSLLLPLGSPAAPSGPVSADTLEESSHYFEVVAIFDGLCPICGRGVIVRSVNQRATQCANGTLRETCIAEVDLSQLHVDPDTLQRIRSAGDSIGTLVRGELVLGDPRFRPNERLVVNEAWLPATAARPAGVFYRVRHTGRLCVSEPCFATHESRINTTRHREISGVDLSPVGADEQTRRAGEQAILESSLLVAGRNRWAGEDACPGGGVELIASQFYLRVEPPPRTPCGPELVCDSASEICVRRETGPVGLIEAFTCEPVPTGCESDRSCGCAGASLCGPLPGSCRDFDVTDYQIDCVLPRN